MQKTGHFLLLFFTFLITWFALPITGMAAVPKFLEPYAQWMQQQNPQWQCTQVAEGQKLKRQCLWLGQGKLTASAKGGVFNGWVDVEIPGQVSLPGDDRYWPSQVQVLTVNSGQSDAGGAGADSVESKSVSVPVRRLSHGVPAIDLQAGRYKITAAYEWSTLPKSFEFPSEWAFLDVALPDGFAWQRNKKSIAFREAQAEKTQNSQRLQVYRHLQEGRPQIITTELILSVTGLPRMLTIASFQVQGSKQMSVSSMLPITTLANGDLQVQVRPGRHSIQHVARMAQQKIFEYTPLSSKIKQNSKAEQKNMILDWPDVEYWAFTAADAGLRVHAGKLVDATQVDMPAQWSHLPVYGVSANTGLELEDKQAQKPLNRTSLTLQKEFWLDFSGAEFVVVDTLMGTMRDQWRLDLIQPGVLERATSGGQPLLITQSSRGINLELTPDQLTDGIEIRDPAVNIETVSRWPQSRDIDLVGWNALFDQVDARLNLPPGWSLLAVIGDQGTAQDWLNKWSLWSLFLGLLLMTFAFKAYDFPGLGLSFLSVVLVYQTAPQLILLLLCAIGFTLAFRQLREQFPLIKSYVGLGVMVFGFLLLLQLVPYTIETARLVLYPQLEQAQVGAPLSLARNKATSEADVVSSSPKANLYELEARSVMAMSVGEKMINQSQVELGEKEFLQTGQAAPQWRWNTFQLGSRAVVKSGESLQVYLLKPWQTALWRLSGALVLWLLFIRIAFDVPGYLQAFAVVRVLKEKNKSTPAAPTNQTLVSLVVLLSLAGTFMPGSLQANEMNKFGDTSKVLQTVINTPSDAVLKDLERYLSRDQKCKQECISLSKGHLSMKGEALTWQMTVNAGHVTAFPLPSSRHWHLQSVTINGLSAQSQLVALNHQVYLKVPEGINQVELTGQTTGAEVRFNLPSPIHQMTYDLEDWFSVNSKLPRLASGELRLERREPSFDQTLDANLLEQKNNGFTTTYLEVTRRLNLGVRWTLTTRIERKSPATGLIQTQIPLWPGEKPTTSLEVKDGQVQVEMSGHVFEWVSELDSVPEMNLVSNAGDDFYETWIVNAGPRWRFNSNGLAPLAVDQPDGMQQQWRPVAGDEVRLTFTRPAAKVAASQSVEKASLTYTLGESVHQASLELQLLAASPGDYTLELDAKASVETIRLNGRPLWSDGSKIVVPLVAGTHTLLIEWQEPSTMQMKQFSPNINSSLPLYNLHMRMVPRTQTWILSVFGPQLGPAVLFWGVLFVIIVGAAGLYWLQRQLERKKEMVMPMNGLDWLLLGLGLSSVWHYAIIPIAIWLFVMSWRQQVHPRALFTTAVHFKLVQLVLILFGIMIAGVVATLIPRSLLANPEMFIQGNGSNAQSLRWFQDATAGEVPSFGFFALPIWVFHGMMLLWSLWLAQKTVQWFKFAFSALQAGGSWQLPEPVKAP